MENDYTVFISAKNLDDGGNPTEDQRVAHALWDFLTGAGFRAFWSKVSLEKMGVSAYTEAIDDALDRAKVLVVVCSSGSHVKSKWVRYEWDSFLNDMRIGLNPDGHVFVYLVGESIQNLPRGLRYTQCIEHSKDGFATLARFIANATGKHIQPNEGASSQPPGAVGTAHPSALTGEWEGEWKRYKSMVLHRGRMSIRQTGERLTAELRITFEKRGLQSIVKELLRGVVTPRCVVLQGESFCYEERGASTSYLLDHFELQNYNHESLLSGDFYSKNGRGRAQFRRIDADPEQSGEKRQRRTNGCT